MASRAIQSCKARLDCQGAQRNLARLETWRDESELASAAYERPPPKTLPEPPRTPRYELVPDADLGKAGLTPADLKIDGTNFGAVVYRHGNPPQYVAAFRGTEEWLGSDMVANYRQALDLKTGGAPTAYYSRAQAIAKRMNRMSAATGSPTPKFIGHSLGGGLASAAAAATGAPATTFNAAGLNPATITEGIRKGAEVAAVHVRGEFLTSSQQASPLPDAYGTSYPLDPPFHLGRDFLAPLGGAALAPWVGPWGVIGAQAVRAGLLHTMGNVTGSLDRAIAGAKKDVARLCGGG